MFSNNQQQREVFTFRHFSRKGSALFAVLGREVRVGVLSAATLASAAPCLSQTMVADGARVIGAVADTVRLDEATVTATRAVSKVTDASAVQVQVLTREDLDRAGVNTVNDVLKLAVGIDVRQRGCFGMQTDIGINGGTFDQMALFVNGFPVTNPQTGHNAADFPVNVSDIQQVEVLEGAGSTIFGAQAFSGAVNIVTRRPDEAHPQGVDAGVSGGSFGTWEAEARGVFSRSRFFSSLSGSFRRSDGAVENSDFRGGKFFWQGVYEARDFGLSVQAGGTLNDFGANTFYSAAYPDQWEATRRYHVGVRAVSKGRVQLLPEVSWMRNVDHYQLIRDTHTGENFHRGDVYTGGIRLCTEACTGSLSHGFTLGAELRQEEIYSTNLGRPLESSQQFSVPGHDSIFYTHRDARTNIAFSVADEMRLGRWTLALRLLAQRNTSVGRHFRFYPGVHLSYATGGWRFYASWNKALRLPTFTDLYYKSPTLEGNVGLQAEENSAFRLGVACRTGVVSADVRAFYHHGTNMIDWVMFAADDVYHATNFRLDNMGFSLLAALDFDAWIGTRQPLKRLSVSYAYIYQNRKDDVPFYKSNYALEYLRHKFVATLDHRIWGPLTASWTLRVQQREGSYLVYEGHQSTGALHPYGTHAVLDGKVSWTKRHYSLFVDLQNLTATRYFDLANVPQPGFFCMVGAKVSF